MTPRARSRRASQKQDPATARVMIVDDHPLIRHGLAELLANQPGIEITAQVPDAAGVWEELERRRPNLVLLDLMLRDSDGLDLIKAVRARYPGVRVLVISMHDEKVYAERVLRAGAAGYVEKHEPPEVVVDAVREVLAGSIYLSRAMGERLLRQMLERGDDRQRSPIATLSDRELQVLDLLGRGLGTPEIARRLSLSAKTVQSHREHLKAKLHLETGVDLMYYAIARQFGSGSEDKPPEGSKPTLVRKKS